MFPEIPITESFAVSTYSFLYVLAITIGLYFAYQECKRYKLPLNEFPPVAFWGVLAGLIGAKVFHIIFSRWDMFLQDPLATLMIGGGWMYYGAEIGGIAGGMIYLAIKRLPVLRPLDVAGIIFMLAHGIGRLGCFGAGCCYGTASDMPWAVHFPHQTGSVHPTQLYESIPLLFAFSIIWIFRKRFIIPGTIFSTYLVFYGIQRFIIEFYRGDNPAIGFLNLTPSQYIAPISLLAGSILWLVLLKRNWQQQQPLQDS